MKRRTLLKAGLATGGVLAVAGTAGLWAVQSRKHRLPPIGNGTRERVETPRSVVVVGGGLAGMATAANLAERGYDVTLMERANDLGGKLSGWPLEVLGETIPMEHGFHGFFAQYYNLRGLLSESGADQALVPQDTYTVLFADGREEAFGTSRAPFPLDLLEVLARSPSLSLSDVAGDRPGMRALLAYDPVTTFERWDHIDAATFVREGGLEGAFAELILRPFGQASMNGLGQFSAAELIRFFHFYMLGNPEGLGFDALGQGTHLSILQPLRRHLESLGVTIRTETSVRRVVFEAGRATGVDVGSGGAEVRIPLDQVPESGWLDGGAVFVRRRGDTFEARDVRCTHMGCTVEIEATGFRCPCHAGRYDQDAKPVSGPPPRPLRRLPVAVSQEQLVVTLDGASEFVAADVVVLATEVGGLKALSASSDFARLAPALSESVAGVGTAEPYAVARFWLDRPVNEERTAFYTVSGYRWTDSIATYDRFQVPFDTWASRTGGSVVECHAYAIPPEDQGAVESYRDAMLKELRQAFPELADANVLHSEVMSQSNFTRFGPGEHKVRTEVQTEIDNLLVVGDHVSLPFPAFLMEAAVSSGILAANRVCAQDGVREKPVFTVEPRGRLATLLADR